MVGVVISLNGIVVGVNSRAWAIDGKEVDALLGSAFSILVCWMQYSVVSFLGPITYPSLLRCGQVGLLQRLQPQPLNPVHRHRLG